MTQNNLQTVEQMIQAREAETGNKIDRNDYKLQDKLARYQYDQFRDQIGVDFLNYYKFVNPNGAFSNPKRYKETYGLNDESVQKMENAEVADHIYEKFLEKKFAVPDYADFIFQMAPRYKNIYSPTSRKGTRVVPDFYSRSELIKLSGSAVEDDEGGVEADRMRLAQSLAYNESIALDGMSNVATEFFNAQENTPAALFFKNNPGANINIRQNPKTGELEFFNPNLIQNSDITDQNDPRAVYQTLNTPSLDLGDFASISGDAMVIVPELIAAYATRGKGMPIPFLGGKKTTLGVETLSAFGAAGMGELGRLALGNYLFGDALQNPPAFSTPALKQAAKSGLVAGLFTTVGKTIEDVGRYMISPTGGRRLAKKFGPKDFNKMDLSVEDAQNLADKINRKLDINNVSSKLVYNIAQATDDVNLKLALAAYERTNIEGMQGVMKEFTLGQAEAFRDFFKVINDEYFDYSKMSGNAPIVDEAYVGNKIRSLLQKKKFNKIESDAYQGLKNAEVNLDKAVKAMDEDVGKDRFEKSGKYIKNAINEANENLNKRYDLLYKQFGKQYNKVNVNLSPLTKVINEMKPKFLEGGKRETAFQNFTNLESLFTKDFIADPNLTLKGAMNTLSDMKTFLRQIDQGLVQGDAVQVGQVKRLVGVFDKQIKKSLEPFGKPGEKGALDEYNDLITGYAVDKSALTRTLGNIMRVDSGVPKILDEDVFATTFKALDNNLRMGQKARIDDLFEVIQDKPRIMQAYKKNIESFYKRQVLNDQGKVDLKKHDSFMRVYAYPMKKIFGDNYKEVTKVGGLVKNVRTAEKQTENLLNKMKEATDYKITNLSPKQIVTNVFDTKDLNTLRDVVKVLETSPKEFNYFKKVIADRIRQNSMDEGLFDKSKFISFLDDDKGVGKLLKVVFKSQPGYLNNLNILKDAMKVARRKEEIVGGKEPQMLESALNHIIRSRIGIFTPEGRVFTAVVGMSQKAYQKRLAQMLGDPKAVENLAKLNNIKIPKKANTIEKVNRFLINNQYYTELMTKTFGYTTGTYPASVPTEKDIKKEIQKREPASDKVSMVSPEGEIGPVEPGTINIFDTDPEKNLAQIVEPTPQQVAQAEMPVQAPPQASGIGALNPQAQAQNFAGLFPQDNLGQAIAQRGNKIG